jgi:hypothetical protein
MAHRVEDRLNNLFTEELPREDLPSSRTTTEQPTKGD